MTSVALLPTPTIGDNQPPSPIDYGKIAVADLSKWLANNPVIETGAQAEQGKLFFDRINSTLGDIEAERVKLVTPLNNQVAEINGLYKSHHNTDAKRPGLFDKIFAELKSRLTTFARREEEKRARIAEEARQRAEESERIAREAEAKEQEAIANAKAGELGVDVTQVVVEADTQFTEAMKLAREAQRAERELNARISGGFSGRALSMRTKETLFLVSYARAITAIGPNDKIRDAILSAARDYRKLKGTLPDGVTAGFTREI
jgi:hypothetical protein